MASSNSVLQSGCNRNVVSFENWKFKVCELLESGNVVKLTTCKTGVEVFNSRGDEPQGCWELYDIPEQYVKFLKEEYELYGPDGE